MATWIRSQGDKRPYPARRGRALVALGAAGIALAAFGASSAAASVTIGEDFSVSGGVCGGQDSYMVVQTASSGNSYAAPFDGVLTSWSSNTDEWATAKLKVVRLGRGNSFTVIGQNGPHPSDGSVNPIRIPVRQGDVLGLFFPLQPCPGGAAADSTYSVTQTGEDVPPGPGLFTSETYQSYQIPVTAQIEHDADHDGYGDQTQDRCPTDPTLHSVCDTFPPQTTITQGPRKRTTRKTATFAFTSSERNSTFQCSLDGAAFRACASPLTVTVSRGTHNFLVRARDRHGNLDTTEASWSWRVIRKRHRRH